MFSILKNWGSAIKVVNVLDRMIKEFPNQSDKDIKYVKEFIQSQRYDEIKVLDKRIQEKFDTKVNDSNFQELGQSYLAFYKSVFPNKEPDLITEKLNQYTYYNFINTKINDDEALSPEEVKEIIIKAKELKIKEQVDEISLKDKYSYYIRNWEIDNGIFPKVQSNYLLNKSEYCIYRNDSTHIYETKLVTERISYGGPSVRIKIMKGVYYNAGGYNISSYKSERNVLIGSGILNLTNERIILKTNVKILTIKLKDIIHIEPYTDGLVISKASGKPIILRNEDSIVFYQYLSGIIRNIYFS